jgi:hypothetical protein
MATELLQKFLDAGLFNFGDDDQRLKDFIAAADDLAKEYTRIPAKVIPAVLVAIDPAVSDTDPILDEAENAVKNHWNSFRNKFSERPKAFLRPVIWEALCRAANGHTEIGSALWLTGASVLPYLAVQKERSIVEDFLLSKGRNMEAEAEQAWAIPQAKLEFSPPTFSLKTVASKAANVDRGALEDGLGAASGPHNQANNKRYNNPNPHWPNQPTNWAWEFAPRAAAAICEQVDKALAPLVNQASALAEQTGPQLRQFGQEITSAISGWVIASVGGLAQRSALMWWKESL